MLQRGLPVLHSVVFRNTEKSPDHVEDELEASLRVVSI
jgi:hypothetical protein